MSLLFQPPTFDDELMCEGLDDDKRCRANAAILKTPEPSPGTPGRQVRVSPSDAGTPSDAARTEPSPQPSPGVPGEGVREKNGDAASFSTDGIPATLRITLSPSSMLRANWGKALRNYERAFDSFRFGDTC